MYQVLVYLIEHRNRVVSKTELFEHAWAEIYVGDAALTQCIATLRRVLGDDRKSQGMIRTYHRHGYRFVAPIQVDAGSAGLPVAPANTSYRVSPRLYPCTRCVERAGYRTVWKWGRSPGSRPL
jgi:DNA-binding winged helix-turn-helix (wHTH) protein